MMWLALSENLARLRKACDLSQEELAAAASVGVDTVGRIERGERRTVRPDTLARLARALGTSPGVLSGDIQEHAVGGTGLGALREAVASTASIPGMPDDAAPERLTERGSLAARGHRAWRWYVDGRHEDLLATIPSLLIEMRRQAAAADGPEEGAAHRLLSSAYRLAAGLAGRLGQDDLAWIAAERALRAARQSDFSEIQSGIAVRYLAWTLVRQGRTDEAERLSTNAAEGLNLRMLERDSVRVGIFGNLIFNAATAAARNGAMDRAQDLLAVARAAAQRAGRDVATEAAIFGPRVAAFQAVEQAVSLGDSELALRLAQDVPPVRGEVPAFWEAGHQLQLASAALVARQDRAALARLSAARHLAPGWVRCQPLGKTTMLALVDRAPRRQGRNFAVLASHYGIVSTRS